MVEELSAAHGTPAVIVGYEGGDISPNTTVALGSRPCIVIAVCPSTALAGHSPDWRASGPHGPMSQGGSGQSVRGAQSRPLPAWADLVLADDDPRLEAVTATINRAPVAAVALAVLLRGGATRSIDDGLAAESAVYSLLQAGPEFATWRQTTAIDARPQESNAVLIERDGDSLAVILNRPQRHNAFTPVMRDGLTEAFQLALSDPTIDHVTLQGAGPSFCSGGDLATFGSFDDPASAHIVRLTRSPARLMAQLAERFAERFEVRLHGACMGAGIELAAFASRVVAQRDARISLPEVALGLVPGAGGTVSIPTRIGRHRTLLLALGGTIDAATALTWGLIDEVTE